MTTPPPYPQTTGYEPCAITDPELFFPERTNNFIKITETAKALCRTCDIQSACLNYAVHTDVEGIWGGTDEKERKAIQKQKGIEPYRFVKLISLLLDKMSNAHTTRKKGSESNESDNDDNWKSSGRPGT